MAKNHDPMRLTTGLVINKNKVRLLGHIPSCNRKTCPIADTCNFEISKDPHHSDRCIFLAASMMSMFNEITDPVNGIGDLLTQSELDDIGIFLMPLYQHAFRLQMDITALKKMTYTTNRGEFVYPQFKEFRETQKSIMDFKRTHGIDKKWRQKFGMEPSLDASKAKRAKVIEDNGRGKPGGYAQIVEMHKALEAGRKATEEGKE